MWSYKTIETLGGKMDEIKIELSFNRSEKNMERVTQADKNISSGTYAL